MSKDVSTRCDSCTRGELRGILYILSRQSSLDYIRDALTKKVSPPPVLAVKEQYELSSISTFLVRLKKMLGEMIHEDGIDYDTLVNDVSSILINKNKYLDEYAIHSKVNTHLCEKKDLGISYHLSYDYFSLIKLRDPYSMYPGSNCPDEIMNFKISIIAFYLLSKNNHYPFSREQSTRSGDPLIGKSNIDDESEMFIIDLISNRRIFTSLSEIQLITTFLKISCIIWKTYIKES